VSTSLPPQGKLLGIDHGLARIGVAVSDATRLLARELAIIKRKSKAEDFTLLKRIAEEQRVVGIIVGIPQDVERSEQGLYSQADKVVTWVTHLQAALPLPIVLWDETLTTIEAKDLARQLRRKPEKPVDDLAARLMLQSYLDSQREGTLE
jgi:putative holliday junction resolvase